MKALNPIDPTRPDFQDSTKIWKLFAPPSDRFNRILSKNHTVIFGPRDSGKTMILKHLSLPIQLKKCGTLKSIPFVGFYIPISGTICNPYLEARRKDPSHQELFSHYFCLMFVERLIDMLIGPGKVDISEELRSQLLECIHNSCRFLKNIEAPTEWVPYIQNTLMKDLGDFVEKNMTLSSAKYPTQVERIHHFVPSLCKQLVDIFSHACGKKVLIYLLVDGYEHFQELAPIFNVLIERHGEQSFVLKMGARNFGRFITKDIWDRNIEPTQDFDVVSLVFDDPSKPQYLEWITNIINNHFNESDLPNFKNKDVSILLSGEDIQMERLFPISMESERIPAFSEKDRTKRHRKYYGSLCFGSLSSGIVGTFVKLCYKVIGDNAFTSKEKLSEAAKKFSWEEFGHILARGGPIELQRLVYWLLLDFEKDFEYGKSPEALPYIIHLSEESFTDDAVEVIHILRKGFEIGVLHSERMEEHEINNTVPRDFWISLSLLPYWGLKPTLKDINIKDYSIRDLINYTKKPYPGEPGSGRPIGRDRIQPKVSKKKVFLSISFRQEDKYEETRKSLKLAISEYLDRKLSWDEFKYSVDKICFDADDMIEGGPLREKVKYGLKRADYALCEIASKNPNVFFELGMIYAFKKPWCPIFNSTLFPGMDTAHFSKFIRGTNTIFYKLTKAGQIAEKREKLRKIFGILTRLEEDKPVPVDPLFEFKDIQVQPNTFYLAHKEETFWQKPQQEIVDHLKNEYDYSEVRLLKELIGKSELVKICYLIKSASLCLIDAREDNPDFCFRLGYAFGLMDEKLVINLHPKDKPVITMWTDMLDIGWSIGNISGDILSELDKILLNYKGG